MNGIQCKMPPFDMPVGAPAALHLALLYLWQLDLLRLESLQPIADAAGLWVLDLQLLSSQLVPQVCPAPGATRFVHLSTALGFRLYETSPYFRNPIAEFQHWSHSRAVTKFVWLDLST